MENKPQTAAVLILDGHGGAKSSDLSQAFKGNSFLIKSCKSGTLSSIFIIGLIFI